MPQALNISAVRDRIGDFLTEAVTHHRPVAIGRRRDQALLLGRDDVLRLVSAYEFHPEVFVEEGAVSIWLPEFALYGRGGSFAEAHEDLLDEVRDYVDEYVKRADEFLRAPNRAHHYPWVLRALLAELEDDLAEVLFAEPAEARLAAVQALCLPQPTYKDLRDFCRIDGWADIAKGRPGRKGKALDHDRYEKRLADGRILKTKVSRGSGRYGDPGMWRHIWRDQLGLESEEQFWEALRTRRPVDRAGEVEAPSGAPPIPGWLHRNLVMLVGMPDTEVARLSLEEAKERWTEFINAPRPD